VVALFFSEAEKFMEGKLVRLRAYERSDLDSIMKWINDEEVTDFLAGGMLTYPVSSIVEEKFIEMAAKSSDTDKSFVIETIAERKYLGGTAFHAINWLNRSAGLGITIGDKSSWGRGYGTDAMKVMMRLGFDKMNLHRLWLHVYEYNSRAIASYDKLGFKREGVLRKERFHRGRYYDTIVMGILEDEYRALP
jgi:RimJ/RimL family protein N-acetyltransferase